VGDEEVDLTQKEFALMSYLINHEGWVVDRNTLLDKVWGEDYFGVDRVVDNTVKRLRSKLGDAGKQIHTAIGRGYKLMDK
ncbi:MAG: winged helix-turn-helix transcriptional regulator, partial [Oscillospiraceae bacterium]|nr:winged helix-turn-helix transcriptional regulator [Oscillospiraceae bacterium]